MKRGDIYYINLNQTVGSEQGGLRPCVIIQNNIGNKYSPTVIIAAITSQIHKAKLPTHVEIGKHYGLEKDSVILMEQIRTVDKRRITGEKVGTLDEFMLKKVDAATMISLGMVS